MKTKFYFLVISFWLYALFVCLRVIMMKKGM